MVMRTRLGVTFVGCHCFVGGAFVCAVGTKHSVKGLYLYCALYIGVLVAECHFTGFC